MSSTPPEAEQNALLDACLDSLRADARQLGGRIRALVRLAVLSQAEGFRRFVALEVAGSLRVGQLTAARWVEEAERYEAALPLTLGMLERGELLTAHATVLLHATGNAPQQIAAQVEAEVLPGGAALSPADLRRVVTRTLLADRS